MKLQPNFSYQKYQDKPEEQWKQFEYQLSQMHVATANTTNATIDDESYWTRERQNSFTWIDGRPVYSKTLATVSWTAAGTTNVIPTGITGAHTVIKFEGYISAPTIQLPLPYIDPNTMANSIAMQRSVGNIVLQSGGTDFSAYAGHVTIYYIKD